MAQIVASRSNGDRRRPTSSRRLDGCWRTADGYRQLWCGDRRCVLADQGTEQLWAVGFEVQMGAAAPDACVAAGADLIATLVVAGWHHGVEMAVAGFQPIRPMQLEGDPVGVAVPNTTLAVMGSTHGCADEAGDVYCRMAFSYSLGDHPGHGVQQLQGREEERNGQQAPAATNFRDENLKRILSCDRRDASVVYATAAGSRP